MRLLNTRDTPAENIGNLCKASTIMRYWIASETPKKQNTLWLCRKNANILTSGREKLKAYLAFQQHFVNVMMDEFGGDTKDDWQKAVDYDGSGPKGPIPAQIQEVRHQLA